MARSKEDGNHPGKNIALAITILLKERISLKTPPIFLDGRRDSPLGVYTMFMTALCSQCHKKLSMNHRT